MRVFLFVFLMLFPLAATAAPGDSVETRLRLLEQKLESQKDDAKTEAGRVENRFLDRIGSLELTVSQQNSHVDQVLSQLNLSIAIGGLALALAALIGGWKVVQVAKGEARDALREMLGEIETAKAEVQALLNEVRKGHGEAMSKIAELKAANIAPGDYTPDQQATIAAAAETAAAKPEAERTEIDHWALAQEAILKGDSGKAADHLAEADEDEPMTWILRARVKFSQGYWDKAHQDAEEALKLSRKFNSLNNEAAALEVLEAIYYQMGEWENALSVCKDALSVSRKIVELDGDNDTEVRNLAVGLRRLVECYIKINDMSSARLHIDEAVRINCALLEKNKDNISNIEHMAKSYEVRGKVYMIDLDYKKSKKFYSDALELYRKILLHDRSNTDWLEHASICWMQFGVISQCEGNWGDARIFALECVALAECLAELDPSNAQWQVKVAVARKDCAICDWELGDLISAKEGLLAARDKLEFLASDGRASAGSLDILSKCRKLLKELDDM